MKKDVVVNNLLFNYFLDMRKKEIDKRQRAQLLATYLDENEMSGRELARQLGVPHSTIHDWLLLNRISDDKYKEYIEKGLTNTDIYRMLRNNKKSVEKDFDNCILKEEIKNTSKKLKFLINQGDKVDRFVIEEIKQLINILNRILIHNERKL